MESRPWRGRAAGIFAAIGPAMELNDRRFRILALCAFGGLALIVLANLLQAGDGKPVPTIPYSQFLDEVGQSRVRSVTMTGQSIGGRRVDGTEFRSFAAEDPDLVRLLRQNRVVISVREAAASPSLFTALTSILPLLLLAVMGFVFMRRMPGAGGMAGLGRSRAKLRTQTPQQVTFADVAGVDEARGALQDIVDFLRDPARFQRLGGRMPRGVLLVGPPGTGKTLLARAVAGEAKVPFFTISGADFVEMFVGVGAARVRSMFEQAKKSAPCIIFMDEIDAVGRHRGAGMGGGSDEREQTLNQLLVDMDGYESTEGIVLIAATNRPDILDPALLRPGRFDRQVLVDQPDILGRTQILQVHLRKLPLAPDVDATRIARGTPGFSGADLMNLVNEAALLAARRGLPVVGMAELVDAKDTVTMGEERRTRVITASEKRLIAYREGGRAIVALHAPAADPVHKATILSRGRSIGLVKQIPEEDQFSITLQQLRARLAILMAGRAAEELVFGRDKITSGIAEDLERATELARQMVTRWGLSERLGAVAYEEETLLGLPVGHQHEMPDTVAQSISSEIRRLLDGGLSEASEILAQYRAQLDNVAQALLERETLTGEEIRRLLAAGSVPSPSRVTAVEP